VDIVAVATVPEHYESRLLHLFPGRFCNLQLNALERHDLVPAKQVRTPQSVFMMPQRLRFHILQRQCGISLIP
jgi:hypothetical protein